MNFLPPCRSNLDGITALFWFKTKRVFTGPSYLKVHYIMKKKKKKKKSITKKLRKMPGGLIAALILGTAIVVGGMYGFIVHNNLGGLYMSGLGTLFFITIYIKSR